MRSDLENTSLPPGRTGPVLTTILRYATEHSGMMPTVREIMALAGISSTSVATYHLGKLHDLGLIVLADDIRARMIHVPGATWTPPAHLAHLVRLVGEAAA